MMASLQGTNPLRLKHQTITWNRNRNRTFGLSLIMICNVMITCSSHSKQWFERIPDESMNGVPEVLVRMEKSFPAMQSIIWDIIGRSNKSYKQAVQLNKVQKVVPDNVPFPCVIDGTRSETRPTNVHQVRPGDIDVIGALGDSLTAANGAFSVNIFQVYIENRGVSFAAGGQGNWRKYLTLPNIIKEFNPNLVGYSTSDASSWEKDAQFNVAHPGAVSQDLPFMVKELVKRIRNSHKVNYKNDWKLITLMIGANNFCLDFCYHQDARKTIAMHGDDLQYTLDYLKANMPRTIVNVLLVPHLRALKELKGVSAYCLYIKVFECPCLFAEQHKHNLNLYYELMDKWQQTETELAESSRYKDKDDFAVNLLPFYKNARVPSMVNPQTGNRISDLTYMSRDCFHFSQKGYALIASSIWNNMMEPNGAKSLDLIFPSEKFLCPTDERPFIFTWKNSNITKIAS